MVLCYICRCLLLINCEAGQLISVNHLYRTGEDPTKPKPVEDSRHQRGAAGTLSRLSQKKSKVNTGDILPLLVEVLYYRKC